MDKKVDDDCLENVRVYIVNQMTDIAVERMIGVFNRFPHLGKLRRKHLTHHLVAPVQQGAQVFLWLLIQIVERLF